LAEDLLSEVFLDVWQKAGTFEARSSVSTWLMAIARYKALSARRRTDRCADDEETAAPSPIPPMIGDRAAEKEPGRTARRSWASLSPEHGEVIDLVYYHEKSVKETAESSASPEATVKTRMFYARKKLADLVVTAACGLLPSE